jgi:hypothetical protein
LFSTIKNPGKRQGFWKAVGGTAVLLSAPPEGVKMNFTTRLCAILGGEKRRKFMGKGGFGHTH